MLYTKNDDKRYTMMCKEFDEEFPKPDRDDNKLYRTMYLVFYMLACKENFFQNNFKYYDDYAQFAATTIYVRFLKKLEKGERVKSLLNYAKSSQRFLKTMFQNQEFETIIDPEHGANTTQLTSDIHDSVVSDYSDGLVEDMEMTLLSINDVIEDVLDESQYCNNKLMRHRIYISCLLTLLNSIILPKELAHLKFGKGKNKNTNDVAYLDALSKEREKSPILWNIDSNLTSMVKVIVNKVRKELSDNINECAKDHTLPDDVVDLILANAYNEGKICIERDEDYD